MKKFVCIIVLLVLVFNLSACSNSGYRYADNWSIENAQVVDVMANIKKYVKPDASKLDESLEIAKELIKESIPYPEYLDWDKFNQLQTIKELSFDGISEMSYEDAYIITNYLAFYDEDSDSCFLLPKFYAADANEQVYALIHEIVHSLVDNRKDADDYQLVEGTVDWLACSICAEDITPSYQESIICLRVLMDIYGEERVIRAVCEDSIVELIDSSTKPGMTEKLNNALAVAHSANNNLTNVKKAVQTELDILTHAAKQEGADISNWLDLIAIIYDNVGIKLDTRYFKNL